MPCDEGERRRHEQSIDTLDRGAPTEGRYPKTRDRRRVAFTSLLLGRGRGQSNGCGFQAIFSLFLFAAQSRKYMLINVW